MKAALSGFAVMRILDIADEWGQYATRNAQLAGDAAACRDLADRHERSQAVLQRAQEWLESWSAWSESTTPR